MTHGVLLAKVWGQEYVEELDYLKVYIRRLRTKLDDDPQNPELIHTERGVGYIYQVRLRSADTSGGLAPERADKPSTESAPVPVPAGDSVPHYLPEYDVTKSSGGKDAN
jgi:DNA-binding winged helix-turn-helix (wHTH) protein